VTLEADPPRHAARAAAKDVPAPLIPADAWRRGIGLPCPDVGHPRVTTPMIDDGEWAGVPIGGLGTGSIGRTFRGDFARWHLEVGTHRFRPSAVDGFAIHVGGTDGEAARTTLLSGLRPAGLPTEVASLAPGLGTYQALFPRAWQTFEPIDLGVRVVGEQLSPVIAHDLESSALPVGVFDWWIDNPALESRTVGVLLTWEDPVASEGLEAAGGQHERLAAVGAEGVVLHSWPAAPTGLRGTFAIAARAEAGLAITTAAGLDAAALRDVWLDFANDGRLAQPAPAQPGAVGVEDGRADPGGGATRSAAIAVTAVLGPGERRSIRFALAWDMPMVEFGAGRRWWKRYTRSWGRSGERAWDLALHAIERADAWRTAIEAWQAPVLADPERPAWYRAALFNELYFLVDGASFWEAGEVGGAEPDPDDPGRFALIECVDYPFYDTVDVDFYASFALLRLFPVLELGGIRDLLIAVDADDPEIVTIETTGLPAVRKLGGRVPHDIGGPDDDPFYRPNRYRFRDVNDWKDLGPKLVLQVWRDALAAGAKGAALIEAAWPTVDAVLTRLAAHDLEGDGLPEHDGIPDQTYDTWPMSGPAAYGGSLWLAALAAGVAMATSLGDGAAARRWEGWFERGQIAFDVRLWRGDHYAYDGGGSASSESIMADQLAGQWYADATGLGDVIDPARVDLALRTIHRRNVQGFAGGGMGAVNGTRPDGSVDHTSEQSAEVWVGTTYALAAFMLGRGLVAEGWETARGAAAVTYGRGLWFRTPEAFDEAGNFRASLYLRPLAIWAIEEALERRRPQAG
jgi:non-lysosomal glucosylceramidase